MLSLRFDAAAAVALVVVGLRVLLCSDYFYPKVGGITTHIEGLARYLEKRGFDVLILTKRASFDDSSHGLRVARIGSLFRTSNTLDVPDTSEVERVLRSFKPDIVHAHHAFSPLSLFTISAAKKLGIPTVLTNHSIQFLYDFDLLWRPSSYVLFPVRQLINNADRIIAVSRAAARFIRYFTDKKVVVVPNGIWVSEFAPRSKRFDGRSILFVGRLVYRKGVLQLLDLMERVTTENPDARLTVAGKGYLATPLKYLAKARGLSKNIALVIAPPRGKLLELYHGANAFVLPSIYGESFGIVILEAMASKTPVVAAKQGGIGEILRNGKTGFLVRRGDLDGMAERVVRVLGDRGLAAALAAKAFETVHRYDWSLVGRRIELIYEEVSSPKR